MSALTSPLDEAQKAGELVENDMVKMLLAYSPVSELRIIDIQQIAAFARRIAFDRFYSKEGRGV